MSDYLILDSSTNTAKIGLIRDDELIADRSIDGKKNLSSSLLVEIEKLLEDVIPGWTRNLDSRFRGNDKREGYKGLDGVIVYLGPGSYTGLRIGVTVANTFAYSLNIPVVGIKGKAFGKEKFETSKMESQNLGELYKKGKLKMKNAKGATTVTPFYGKGPNVG